MRTQSFLSRIRERGISIVEVMITLTLLGGTLVTVASSVSRSGAAKTATEQRALAVEVALSKADEIRATPIDLVFATWGPGGTEGDTFSDPSLDQGAPAGSVQVIVDETATDADLGTNFGLPRDLDGDGLALTTDVSTTALVLPVVVQVRWGPAGGTQRPYRVPVVVLRTD